MTNIASVGYSLAADSFAAGVEAARMAQEKCASLPPVVGFVYTTVIHEQGDVLQGILSVFPGLLLVGASTQGISRQGAVDEIDRVVGFGLLASSSIKAHAALATDFSKDPKAAGLELAAALSDDRSNPLLLWYDPLTGANVDELLSGLSVGGFPLVIGGGAGQPWGPMHKTYQYFQGEVYNDAAIVLQLEGCDIVYDLTHGTESLGLELSVSEAHGNVLTKIDGEPALDVWIEQLGGGTAANSDDTAAWVLGVHLSDEVSASYEGPVTRAVFGFNTETKELILQAPIATGTTVELCHRTPEAVFDRALLMAERFREQLAGRKPFFVHSFECGARPRPFLGEEQAKIEVQEMQSRIGAEIPWLGFYAWGEVAPIGQRSYFHNFTFPLCVFCEPA